MPISLANFQSTCYDPINCTPAAVPTAGVGANIIKYSPLFQVAHRTNQLYPNIFNILYTKVSGGDSYYLPFQSDGITSVSLPEHPQRNHGEPIYFFTIRLTACAIFIDHYQPTVAAGYVDVFGAADLRPRLIISHANAVAEYQQAVNDGNINVGANPTWFPFAAMAKLSNYRNTAIGTYPGIKQSRTVLLKSDYNQPIKTEMDRLIARGCSNVAYGATTVVMGFYQPGGWRFYFQTWAAFDYDKGSKQVRDSGVMTKYRVLDCRQFYP